MCIEGITGAGCTLCFHSQLVASAIRSLPQGLLGHDGMGNAGWARDHRN